MSPSLDIADNLFLGREPRAPEIMVKVYRKLDPAKMRAEATKQMTELGFMTIQDISQQVESLSGGQRQGVAVARAAAFGSKVIVLDEPPAALASSHNMPHVVEVADRIHFHRLGGRIAVVTPKTHTMNEVVATMTGAAEPGAVGYDQVVKDAERADPRRSAEASRRRSRTAETAAGGPSSPSRCRPPDSASAEVPGAGRSSRTGGPRRSCGP